VGGAKELHARSAYPAAAAVRKVVGSVQSKPPSKKTHQRARTAHNETIAVVLVSCSQSGPTGGLAARVGIHGSTKPLGRTVTMASLTGSCGNCQSVAGIVMRGRGEWERRLGNVQRD
jgi:hypothetical protein